MSRSFLFVAVLAAAACSKKSDAPAPTPAPATAPVKVVKDPAAAKKLIAAGAVVLDVRSAEEFGEGHLPMATNIPIQDFAKRIAEVDKLVGGDKTKPIVVHCSGGFRAAKAQAQLEAAGYTHVVNGGGYDDLR